MSDYCTRLYRNSEYVLARDIFARGVREHTPAVFYHALSFPHMWLFLVFLFLLSVFTIGSIYFAILAIALMLIILWRCSWDVFHCHVRHCLSNDMQDIHKHYLQRDGCCFWVAESVGQVVGMVAAVPSPYPNGENHIELKRFSVTKSHRGKGIGQALCRTLIDFAQKRRCEAVVLETSIAQTDAQRLYEKMGFRVRRTFIAPNRISKLLGFRIWFYQYDISNHLI